VNDDLGRRVKELAAKLHDTRYGMEMWPVLLADAIESAQRDAAEAERERCKAVCEAVKPDWHKPGCGCSECATASSIAERIQEAAS
jgi:hypothetical protein